MLLQIVGKLGTGNRSRANPILNIRRNAALPAPLFEYHDGLEAFARGVDSRSGPCGAATYYCQFILIAVRVRHRTILYYFLRKNDGKPPQLSSSSSSFLRGVFEISTFETSFTFSCFSGVSIIFFISSRARGFTGGTSWSFLATRRCEPAKSELRAPASGEPVAMTVTRS